MGKYPSEHNCRQLMVCSSKGTLTFQQHMLLFRTSSLDYINRQTYTSRCHPPLQRLQWSEKRVALPTWFLSHAKKSQPFGTWSIWTWPNPLSQLASTDSVLQRTSIFLPRGSPIIKNILKTELGRALEKETTGQGLWMPLPTECWD